MFFSSLMTLLLDTSIGGAHLRVINSAAVQGDVLHRLLVVHNAHSRTLREHMNEFPLEPSCGDVQRC